MKIEKRIIGLSAIRALLLMPALLLGGCVAKETEEIEVPEEAPVPIEFGITGVTAQQEPTRSGEVNSCPVDFLGWDHTGTWSSSSQWSWKATSAKTTDGSNTTVTGSAQVFALNPRKYYNANNNNKTTLVGFYPQVVLTTAAPTTGPSLYVANAVTAVSNGLNVYPADGTVDIITSTAATGSKNSPIGTVSLRHVTSQIVLKIKAKSDLYESLKSLEIQKVALKNLPVPTQVTVAGALKTTKKLTEFVVFTASSTKKYVPQTEQVIGIPAFATPGADKPTIEVTLSQRGTMSCNFPITGSLVAGKKYVITIEVSAKSLNVASATITDWAEGNTYSGEAVV